jgi:hypothetical protein
MTSSINTDIYDIGFDESRRILHLAHKRTLHPTTPAHLETIFQALRRELDQYISAGRIYLIINMTNFILEPDMKTRYAELARGIRDIYIMPNGIARYGFQITRITVRQSYDRYLCESPNIFNSRGEAFAYINSLIDRHKKAGITTDSSIPVAETSARLSEH